MSNKDGVTRFQPLVSKKNITRHSPLYVGHFFQIKGSWRKLTKKRQDLICSVVAEWYYALKKCKHGCSGWVTIPIYLTQITEQVYDAKIIIEHFFDIVKLGHKFSETNKSPTYISPKKLDQHTWDAAADLVGDLEYDPGPEPSHVDNLTTTMVTIDESVRDTLIDDIKKRGYEDYVLRAQWLLKQKGPIKFFWKKAGEGHGRDTSVWPLRSWETWPTYIREQIAPKAIDIENAWPQFVQLKLYKQHEERPQVVDLLYPNILRYNEDKHAFRQEIVDLLKPNLDKETALKKVKQLLVSISNGSNISPRLLQSRCTRQSAVNIVLNQMNRGYTHDELENIGTKLRKIVVEFRRAIKSLVRAEVGPLKKGKRYKKMIFRMYFKWERWARYKIAECMDFSGFHLHDCFESSSLMDDDELVRYVKTKTGLKVAVKSRKKYTTSTSPPTNLLVA